MMIAPKPEPHVKSWYAATAVPYEPFPTLESSRHVDVCVIGGGFTGLSAAIELTRKGMSVAVLEANRVGWGASGRNGGQIIIGYNKSMAKIASWVGDDDARKLWDLQAEAIDLVRDRVETYDIACDLRWGYVLAGTKARHIEDLKAQLDEWETYGHTGGQFLDKAALNDRVRSDAYVGGLFDANSGQLHPLNYAIGLAEAARREGAQVYEGSPALSLERGSPAVVRTPRGSITANHILFAGNAYLRGLAPETEARIMPAGTYIIATEPLSDDQVAAALPQRDAVCDNNFVLSYYRISADNRMLYGGGVSYKGFDSPGLDRTLASIMARYYPHLADCRIDYLWGGNVAITRNRTPHLTKLGPNIYQAQGFSGHGVALTGMAGRVISEAIAGTADRFDVFARLPHENFPGGRHFRTPLLVLAMLWFRMRDML